MSKCGGSNKVASGCTYSSTPADGVITATQDGNNFQFYGLIAGPGIQLTQSPTTIIITPTNGPSDVIGKFVNMGQDLVHAVPINYTVTFNSSGPGQYDQIGDTIPITTRYRVSWDVTYSGTQITTLLEDADTGVLLASASTSYISSTKPDTISSSRKMLLNAGQRLRFRITSTAPGTLFLSKSYLTISN